MHALRVEIVGWNASTSLQYDIMQAKTKQKQEMQWHGHRCHRVDRDPADVESALTCSAYINIFYRCVALQSQSSSSLMKMKMKSNSTTNSGNTLLMPFLLRRIVIHYFILFFLHRCELFGCFSKFCGFFFVSLQHITSRCLHIKIIFNKKYHFSAIASRVSSAFCFVLSLFHCMTFHFWHH